MKKLFFVLLFFILFTSNNVLSSEKYHKTVLLNNFGITSLMRAVADNNSMATEIFLRNNSDVNEKNFAGVSVLHVAVKNNSKEALIKLLEYKPKIDIQDDEGFTPLMRACLYENPAIVEILLNHNAEIWIKNKFNEVALVLSMRNDCLECASAIINKDLLRLNTTKKLQYVQIRQTSINEGLKLAFQKQNKELETLLLDYQKKISEIAYLLAEEDNNNTKRIKKIILILEAERISEAEFGLRAKENTEQIKLIFNKILNANGNK